MPAATAGATFGAPAAHAARRADPRQRLLRVATSCWRTQALRVAVELDLPDHMAAGARSADELAAACGGAVDGVRRLLRALCTLQACRETRDGRFALTAAGSALCRHPADGEVSLRPLVLWWGGPMWPLWADLDYSVRTGRSARLRRTGQANYDFLDGQPDAAALFHETMRIMTALVAPDVARLATWREAREVVDVGGGHGELAAAIAAAHPHLHAIVLDRPNAEAGARALLEAMHLTARVRFAAGDFFAAIPAGADRYLLKSILHNWDDAACARLLARCADAAPRGARLLVVERVLPDRLRSLPHDEALARTDLNMLAGLGGRERSLTAFTALLEPAGFALVGVTRTGAEFSVIETRRV